MSHVKEVRPSGDGRYHWRVGSFEWEAEVTRREPNRTLAWQSLPGSSLDTTGTVHFEPHPRGGTRLDLRLSYRPPAGLVGHGIAKLLGADPKKQIDDDLLRFKTMVEGRAQGAPPAVH